MDRRAKVRFRFTPKPLLLIPLGLVGIWMAISEVGFDVVKWYIPLGIAGGAVTGLIAHAGARRRGWFTTPWSKEAWRTYQWWLVGLSLAFLAFMRSLGELSETVAFTVLGSWLVGLAPFVTYQPVPPPQEEE